MRSNPYFTVIGKLVDKENNNPPSGEIKFNLSYEFTASSTTVKLSANSNTEIDNIRYYLPVVSDQTEGVELLGEGYWKISKAKGSLAVTANKKLEILHCEHQRIFNHVPGFQAIPFYVKLKNSEAIEIRMYAI